MQLRREFFARDTLIVARDLLGQRLVRTLVSGEEGRAGGKRVAGRIVELEAYIGEEDEASHASPGRTRRNAPMYGPPGHAYVYLIYGMYHCFNVVTEREGFPAAILIRALEPLEGLEVMWERRGGRSDEQLTSGPGRLCEALSIDRRLNGADLCTSDACLFVEADEPVSDCQVAVGPRINVRGNEAALKAPWRFTIQGNRYVSR
ncbi:MAG: DNA-3-methyladenine glycosylase [Anaerolineae bacterium]|jgi:DNA-3-methyladenine glycosylase